MWGRSGLGRCKADSGRRTADRGPLVPLTAPWLLAGRSGDSGRPRLSQRWRWFVCAVGWAGRGGGRSMIGAFVPTIGGASLPKSSGASSVPPSPPPCSWREGHLLEGRPLLSQRWRWFVCAVRWAGRGGGRSMIGAFVPTIGGASLPKSSGGVVPFLPHLPHAVGGKAICWRDAPSSPSDGESSSVLWLGWERRGKVGDWRVRADDWWGFAAEIVGVDAPLPA
jgi:hypothetical protein